MTPNSFLIVAGPQCKDATDSTYKFSQVSLTICKLNSKFINLETRENGFEIFFGEAHKKNRTKTFRPAGTQLVYDDSDKVLSIKCDRLGTAILFWTRNGDSFFISNRLENLIGNTTDPDWSSIQQYLHTGFTIKDTTFYKNVYQTEPSTNLQFQFTQSAPSAPSLLVSELAHTHYSRETDSETLTEEIGDQLSSCIRNCHPSVLMMSAGWDSRTLMINGTENIIGAYSHGDLSSRELGLTRTLSGNQRLDHLFSDVISCPITPSLIDQMLREVGFGIFPIWFIAAQNIMVWKNLPMMSGVLGELLGGHYGLMSWGSRAQKLSSSFLLINDNLVGNRRLQSLIDQYSTPPTTHWFISDSGQKILDNYRRETKERSLDAIEKSYQANGNWQRALEDFNMSHRARQYIMKQAQAASSTIGYTVPFANDRLTDLVRSLKFSERVHNKTNRLILKSINPQLLCEPMAATLIAAKYPILLQEASRVLRVIKEQFKKSLGREPARLGWFNYEHLYNGSLFPEIIDSLVSDLWSKERMNRAIASNPKRGIDAGSTLDMLCKIKTIDYYLELTKRRPKKT